MKHLKKFESNDYTSLRGEILDLCSELIDNGIRCEVSPLGSHSARLSVNLDLDLGQWARGYQDVPLKSGDFSDSIKFFDLYKDRLNFVTNEISEISKRLESSGFVVKFLHPIMQTQKNDYFMITISKDTEEGASTSLLKRKSFRPFMRSL